MITNDVEALSQWLQYTMLCIHKYSVHTLYKPCPQLYIVDWLSQNNHTENRDQEITGMNVNMHTISNAADIPIYTSIHIHRGHTGSNQPRCGTVKAKKYIIRGWPHFKDEVEHSIQKYWPIRNELAMINDVAMKCK